MYLGETDEADVSSAKAREISVEIVWGQNEEKRKMFRNRNENKKRIKVFQNWNINLKYEQIIPKQEQ